MFYIQILKALLKNVLIFIFQTNFRVFNIIKLDNIYTLILIYVNNLFIIQYSVVLYLPTHTEPYLRGGGLGSPLGLINGLLICYKSGGKNCNHIFFQTVVYCYRNFE